MNPYEPLTMRGDADVARWRRDFPILESTAHGKPLVYLDNGATTQKPLPVIEAERAYYLTTNANVHRGVHLLSQRATEAYEAARARVARFVNAARAEEIVFVRGTTEAINLVAQSDVRPRVQAGDEILITAMEHHANIVPWQLVCMQTGATLKVVPIDDSGSLDVDAYARMLSARTRLVALAHVSNALGTINPVAQLIELAHARGVPVLVDGAQAVAHLGVDVRALDCDFYAFSGHKIYGPTGIGVLYAKAARLDAMPPWQGGGDMIRSVTFEKTEYNAIPWKFEAGTPNIAGAIALAAALDYVDAIGIDALAAHEAALLDYATDAMRALPGVRLVGTAARKAGILSFVHDAVHAHDIGTILDRCGVAVRAGHHCAMPVMQRFRVPATVRASFALYNTRAEIDALLDGMAKVQEVFGR
ncbi:cysteine desulfurase [Trinickia caryophylli]|uniref:Cysteine desulfurase n=1 Tax=Trinickia caryophylli TaxID=28094 RepID=A0A1X7DFC8_TRICW|nr:cysteine desulfurase [Trinickia caryophylli]PMS09834.1 cysteine desulfurase [Trinickia caryophylli]TRX16867.1 cysteine desulfurase [Trinickia caryophylli]WQE12403.1 cysteine desulfurase [Trinickia caryophylli]SMF13989.1 cysteine desulfurase / selenocysteine lyase [Trinickia caryophylli]GLU31449.1 cysteine desulfurase [Trinickia caryophylli]